MNTLRVLFSWHDAVIPLTAKGGTLQRECLKLFIPILWTVCFDGNDRIRFTALPLKTVQTMDDVNLGINRAATGIFQRVLA